MKQLLCLTVAFLTLLFSPCGSRANEKREKKLRMKGVELYSWKEKEGDWVFVLLNGTNRAKTAEEVKQADAKVKDIGELKRCFARLAVGEQVFWMHPVAGFDMPPEAQRKAVVTAAKDAQLDLQVVDGTTEPIAGSGDR